MEQNNRRSGNGKYRSGRSNFSRNNSRGGRGRGGYGQRRYNNRPKMKAAQFAMQDFINTNPEQLEARIYTPQHTFSDFAIDSRLKAIIAKQGYTTPTPIQDQTIQVSLKGNDVIGLANTGTGKTAAFLIPMINKLIDDSSQQCLIITPTRELAFQIEQELRKFTQGLRIFSTRCIGGESMYRQINQLKRKQHFIIGTPGRLLDLGERRAIDFSQFQNIVLDEVDRMMDMGFLPDIKRILSQLPQERQSLFFSATMPPKIQAVVQEFMCQPVTVSVLQGNTSENVYQDVIKHKRGEDKSLLLREILSEAEYEKVLVFAGTKRRVDTLHMYLRKSGIASDSIHGDKSQSQRSRSILKFKMDQIKVLIATDVAARGLDISGVTHVINYDLPQSFEDYVHRIGRTGRAGKSGKALTFFEHNAY